MANSNTRAEQAQVLKRFFTPIGAEATWRKSDPKTLAAFASWVFKVRDDPTVGAGAAPCAGFDDHANGLPHPPSGQSGYDGAAFLHKASGTLVLASRGSETLEDWLRNATAALEFHWKQLGPALEFAADAVAAATRILGKPPERVECAGNSLGGALAEGQVALLGAVLDDRGIAAPKAIEGFGTGSAAFAGAIRKYGAQRFPDLPEKTYELRDRMTHMIRRKDPIMGQHKALAGKTLGKVIDTVADIYVVNLMHHQPPKGTPETRWQLVADATNHNDFNYFRFLSLNRGVHLVKPKSSDFFSEPGEGPEKLWYPLLKLPDRYA
jgi:hypothetical protein